MVVPVLSSGDEVGNKIRTWPAFDVVLQGPAEQEVVSNVGRCSRPFACTGGEVGGGSGAVGCGLPALRVR